MSINQVSFESAQASAVSAYTKSAAKPAQTTDAFGEAAVYEPANDRSALVESMKADMDRITNNMLNMVKEAISTQGQTIGTADDMWRVLASGKFTASPEAIAQAKADTAEDGFWGAEKTSSRMVDFAIALSGGDTSKAETLINAFKKGFEEATKTWGGKLPDLCQKTFDLTLEKFNLWVNGKYPE